MREKLPTIFLFAAVILIAAGVAQRTLLMGPGSIFQKIEIDNPAPYVVIDAEDVASHDGRFRVSFDTTDLATVAYGRTSDVMGWIGDAAYTRVSIDDVGAVDAETVAEDATGTPEYGSPLGSDLWLKDFAGQNLQTIPMRVPDGYVALVASDGTAPAAEEFEIAWVVDSDTPLAGPSILLGVLFGIAGFVMMYLNWRLEKTGRGPRRKGPQQPQPRKSQSRAKAFGIKAPRRRQLGPTGRRRRLLGMVVLGGVALPLALSGCSREYWPDFSSQPEEETVVEPTASSTSDEARSTQNEPAVTLPQMQRVLESISVFAAEADATLNATLLPQRFAGSALESRVANYRMRTANAELPGPLTVPAAPLTIVLPQQVESTWPRTVIVVSQHPTDETIAPVTMVMMQESARDNYKIHYMLSLAPEAKSPEVAPAEVGAPSIAADSKLLQVAPSQLAAAYADVLNNDTNSAFAALFDLDSDSLRSQVGVPGQEAIRSSESFPENAAISFTAFDGGTLPIALAANDAGGVIAVTVKQTRQLTPSGGGVVGWEPGLSTALSGFTGKSTVGVQSTSAIQMLFYVPTVGSTEKIVVLGWNESLVEASEMRR